MATRRAVDLSAHINQDLQRGHPADFPSSSGRCTTRPAHVGFRLIPAGFFAANPALDVPR